MREKYRIAIDAMGGDKAPSTPIEGALRAARETGAEIILVGDPISLGDALQEQDTDGISIHVQAADGVILEGEHPALGLRKKPNSSIAVCAGLVAKSEADAMISVGSTGATMAAAVLNWGLFPGLERPTLGGPFIGLAPNTTIIDLGANVDSKPSQLLSFASLGSSFSRFYHGIRSPRVGLLSVGAEEGKGNRLVQDAFSLMKNSNLRFVGNIEGHEIFEDKADVVVCDGFVGNVLLKYTEGLARTAASYLARKMGNDSEAVQQIRGLASAAEQGGGPLFGVNGVAIAGHGSSSLEGIAGAVKLAINALQRDFVAVMRHDLAQTLAETGPEETSE